MSFEKTAKLQRKRAIGRDPRADFDAQRNKRPTLFVRPLIVLAWLAAAIAGYLSVTPNATDAAIWEKGKADRQELAFDRAAIQLGSAISLEGLSQRP